MGEQSPEPANTPTGAVFLSYASQDADAAKRICDALRAAGIEVWFDQSELRGGDAWDRHIRQQIQDCRLFIAVISAQTETRDEGYFRREWRLAAERAGDMAGDKPFVVPVAIDGTSERTARVPDPFKHVQWTRLPGGEASPDFGERIQRLLSPAAPTPIRGPALAQSRPVVTAPVQTAWPQKPWLLVAVAVAVLGVAAYLVIEKPWVARPAASSQTVAAGASAAAFNPPPHSIAVLPFVNMSGDKEQEYFSDGLSEELLNDLSRIHELRVCARTSAFSFKGKDTDIGTIARKLNVGAVLEGSVRRSASTLRVTAQLIDSVSGYHLWSQTYDRAPGDALKLQTEIAEAVASALKVTLLGDFASRIEVGGTRNPLAYDAYLRAMHDYNEGTDSSVDRAIAGFREAARLDPNFAQAFAALSIELTADSGYEPIKLGPAHDSALKAIQLAPDLAEGHLALAIFHDYSFDFMGASKELERAVVLGPGNVRVLRDYGDFTARMGHPDAGVAVIRRAVALDPTQVWWLGQALRYARRYDESIKAYEAAASLSDPGDGLKMYLMLDYYGLGEFQKAASMLEELKGQAGEGDRLYYLAMVYHKLGRAGDAETSLKRLIVFRGEAVGYTELADIYAQWGNTAKALESLEKAAPGREPDLRYLKVDAFLDPIRNEPRYKAVERALKFPD
jgi:TolB-like protein